MLSGKARIPCIVLSVFILLGCGVIPSFASLMPVLAGCATSDNSGDQNSNPVTTPVSPVYDTADINSYNLYFGKLNVHSNQSDGILSLDGAYKYARDIAKLDFLGITDNSDMLDNGAAATLSNGNVSSEWAAGKTAANNYTSGSFVGIYGFEMAWNNGNGHINTYNTEGFETSGESAYTGSHGLYNYYNALKQYPASLSQFNGTQNGDFGDFGYWDPQMIDRLALFEVGSGTGTVGSAQYYPSYGDYTKALDAGWHLAPANGQELGDTNAARTVVLAKSLTRNDVYNAIASRRVYATEDKNLKIRYSINGQPMGATLGAKPANLHLIADIQETGGEKIGTVSVYASGGKLIKSQSLAVDHYTLDLTLSPDYSYYYLRVDQFDKDIAVTAPIWVPADVKAGILKTTINTTAPKKGVSLKITSEVYNNENSAMTISSLAFYSNGKEIKTLYNPGTVKAGTTAGYSVDYVPQETGKHRIDITMRATVKGLDRLYTDAFILDVGNTGGTPTPTPKPTPTPCPTINVPDCVKDVIKLIDKIKWTGNKFHIDKINEARIAYDALTKDQKKLVSNYDKLVSAEEWVKWMDHWQTYWGHHKGKKH